MTLLALEGLTIRRSDGVALVEDVTLEVARGERVALVGESGSGKSLTAAATIGLLPRGLRASGSIRLDGRDLLGQDERAWCAVRGKRVAMVFQEPATALDPVRTIGRQIGEAAAVHDGLGGAALDRHVRALMAAVGLPGEIGPERYPHELSGGQRQRAMIAAALAASPDLILADEPTSALDVVTQRVVLDLLRTLCAERGTALILITHDLAVAATVARRVVVLYAGTVVETGPVEAVFSRLAHPYTRGLVAARPGHGRGRIAAIPGQMPAVAARPAGCRFHPRCPRATERCRTDPPPLAEFATGHSLACHHPHMAAPP